MAAQLSTFDNLLTINTKSIWSLSTVLLFSKGFFWFFFLNFFGFSDCTFWRIFSTIFQPDCCFTSQWFVYWWGMLVWSFSRLVARVRLWWIRLVHRWGRAGYLFRSLNVVDCWRNLVLGPRSLSCVPGSEFSGSLSLIPADCVPIWLQLCLFLTKNMIGLLLVNTSMLETGRATDRQSNALSSLMALAADWRSKEL